MIYISLIGQRGMSTETLALERAPQLCDQKGRQALLQHAHGVNLNNERPDDCGKEYYGCSEVV